jgi:bifunctional non-homologous end joining protein LigD
MHVTDRRAIAAHRENSPTALMAFDILMYGAKPLIDEPWSVRRKLLERVLKSAPSTLRLTEVQSDGKTMLAEAEEKGWEGIIAKRTGAHYHPGERSRDWLKLKIEQRQEFVVGGYTEPRSSREHFGAVLLGYYADNGDFVYAGHTGGGFSRATLLDMYRRLHPLETDVVPFVSRPKTNEPAHWVKPRVVVEVKFNEWTADGKLRQPIFVGVRDDKRPREVVREPVSKVARAAGRASKPSSKSSVAMSKAAATKKSAPTRRAAKRPAKKTPAVTRARASKPTARKAQRGKYAGIVAELQRIENEAGGSGTIELDTGQLTVSNLGKVFFPKTGQTKGDLMRYYATVAPFILPAVADRPLVLRRFPNGIAGKAFYQQKAPADPPASVRVEKVSDEGLTTQPRLIGGDLATLLYLVQLGAVSVDPWHSRVPRVQYADYSIVDLDPGPRAGFSRVIEVALWVKEVLDEFGLHAVPKISGATGIHVVMPLGPGITNDTARMAAELVATTVADRHAKQATVTRMVKARGASSVYVDYLQNIRGKTVAGVYSARAKEGATVSMPLTWDEVGPGLDPRDFTIESAAARLEKVGDLWAKGMKRPNKLERLFEKGKR